MPFRCLRRNVQAYSSVHHLRAVEPDRYWRGQADTPNRLGTAVQVRPQPLIVRTSVAHFGLMSRLITRGVPSVRNLSVRFSSSTFTPQPFLAKTMSSDQKIADLKRQLGETVQRIDSIQSGRQLPLTSRIAQHFRTQTGSLINVVLTASVLAVALGKMQQKQQFQVHRPARPWHSPPVGTISLHAQLLLRVRS